MRTVSILVPCTNVVHSEFASDLSELRVNLVNADIPHWLHMTKGSILPSLRQELVNEAMTIGAEYMLWIDSDMTFPKDLFQKLVKHDKDITACTYSTRDGSNLSVAFQETGVLAKRIGKNETGLVSVDAVGMGAMLIKSSVFMNLPKPWFNFYWDHEYEYFNGEDIYFCEQARSRGYEIWVDCDLSKEIGHLGTYEYKL